MVIASLPIAWSGAILLGYALDRIGGAILLAGLSSLGLVFCFVGAAFYDWTGFYAAMLLVAGLAFLLGILISGKRRGGILFSLLWLGLCAVCVLGYRSTYDEAFAAAQQKAYLTNYKIAYRADYQTAYAKTYRAVYQDAGRLAAEAAARQAGQQAGRIAGEAAVLLLSQQAGQQAGPLGLYLISFPMVIIFWGAAIFISQQSLPFSDPVAWNDRLLAFQALITYLLGTNYPYYAIENRKATVRAPGNESLESFAGPGIIISSCDHTVIISDETQIKAVKRPGLSFTEISETIEQVIDLRIQQRVFQVEALTKDGIRVKVPTGVVFRLHPDWPPASPSPSSKTRLWPEPGKPFPYKSEAIFSALQQQPIEHLHEERGGKVVQVKQKRTWDEMVSTIAARVIRRVISEYTFDDLCAPHSPDRKPRQEIAGKLEQQLQKELESIGIEVVGSGISNLLPADEALLQQRIANWQAEWERRMATEMGQSNAEYIRLVENARAQAQAEMIRTISDGLERARASDASISSEVIALRFVEALEEMIQNPALQQALPVSSIQTVQTMKQSLEDSD